MMFKFFKKIAFVLGLPLSLLWEWAYQLRRFLFKYGILKQNSFRVPIISIGNLTFGGTGKTPFTLWLSEYLESLDKKVLIVMRGYKGRLEDSHGLIKGSSKIKGNPLDFGDEALVLARRLKNTSVVVGKKRSENLEYYFKQEAPDAVLLDDGHQHLKLHRNLNILLFDALLPIDRYKVAPLGYMREGFSAMKDADLIVVGRADQVSAQQRLELKNFIFSKGAINAPMVEIGYRPTAVLNSSFVKAMDVEELQGKKVICIAGIASPTSFYQLVENLGANIIYRESFPDHHYFKAEEISKFITMAEENGAIVLTTEKDIVKIRRISDDSHIAYLEIKVNFLTGEKVAKEIISRAFFNTL